MATSSITKEFTVKDIEKFTNIVNELNKPSTKRNKIVTSHNLEEGKKLLAEFLQKGVSNDASFCNVKNQKGD